MTAECTSGLGLYYIAGDKEDASHFDSHNRVYPWPTLESILWKYSSDEVGNAIH
jgi:hypothetical protein